MAEERRRIEHAARGGAHARRPHANDALSGAIEDTATVNAVTTHIAPKHRTARRVGIVFGVVIVLAAIIAAGAYVSYQMGLWGDVEVPDTVGMKSHEAQRILAEAGFESAVHEEKVDEGYGLVSSMDPEAGEMVRHGSTIDLGVGVQRTMPDVIGLKPDAARKLIAAEGVTGDVPIEYRVSVDQAEDTVIEAHPEAGSTIKSTDTVTLVVARALKVPDVKGMQQNEACAAIEELGLATQVEWRESSEAYQTVLETDPLPGTRVEKGSLVTVFVASGGPRDRWHMTEYLGCASMTVADYLTWQQWDFQFSDASDGVIWTELWRSGNYDLFFGYDPWSFSSQGSWNYDYSDSALAYGAAFDAVRMNFADLSDDAVDEKTVQKYMDICGFDNPQDTCTDKDITLPNKRVFDSMGISRVCTYGVTDGVTWVILLKGANDGAVDVSLVAMDESAVARLTADGGSVCDMFMYRDAYPNGEPGDEAEVESDNGAY